MVGNNSEPCSECPCAKATFGLAAGGRAEPLLTGEGQLAKTQAA